MTNGQLLNMAPEQRARTIAGLTTKTRTKLAALCALGANREITKAREHQAHGRLAFADRMLETAARHTALAAELTADQKELVDA